MDDKQIIDLYFARSEQAVRETEQKYGAFCHRIAMNILGIHEDAEECVNDTYYSVWKQIPPTVPESFKAFIGRITRNTSISRFRTLRAKKRYSSMDVMLSELSDCVPSSGNVEQAVEVNQFSEYISDWLDLVKWLIITRIKRIQVSVAQYYYWLVEYFSYIRKNVE